MPCLNSWNRETAEVDQCFIVQSLSYVRPFVNPWTAARQASLYFTYLLALAQTHVHWVSDAIQPTYHLSSPSPALKLSQYHGLCQWVSSSYWVAKVLALQFHQESFQWIFRVDFLLDWLVWSPFCQESSAASQVKIINSLVLSLLCPQTFG